MFFSKVRGARTALSAVIVGALVAGLGLAGALPATAAAPPITFSIDAVTPSSGAPVTEVTAGADFAYAANVGCPDPDGCGPATLVVTFPADVEFLAGGFNPPAGATVEVDPAGNGQTAQTVTITWENLNSAAVLFLPARVSADTNTSQNGSPRTAVGTLSAGEGEDAAEITRESAVSLRVFAKPGVLNATQSWDVGSVIDGTPARAVATLSAQAAANSPSTLSFVVPSAETIPGSSLSVGEVFDLGSLALSEGHGGGTVTFAFADGGTEARALPADALEVTAPAGAVGFTVELTALPAVAAGNADARTVTITADYALRDTRRSNGGPIIDPTFTSRQVRNTAQVTNTVADAAPGAPTTATLATRSDITVNTVPAEIKHSLVWKTASGDATSVYGSREASTATFRLANGGVPSLSELSLALTRSDSSYFDFQELTAVPEVTFPAGATAATIQYRYATAPLAGDPLAFGPGDTVPGPDAEGRGLGEITGITVTFLAGDGGRITGECALDGACAGTVVLSSVLRDTHLTSGKPITPPASNPGTSFAELVGKITATTTTGATLNQNTTTERVTIVKPQLAVKMSKRFGDGSDQLVYPLTGVARAGDLYDDSVTTQNFADHKLRLTASTSKAENATEQEGATELTIVDPQTTPTLKNLSGNPFNAIKLTAFPGSPAVCTDPDGGEVGSDTAIEVWVLDRLVDPLQVTKLPFDPAIDLDLVVGFEISITPTAASGRFPVDVSCAATPGATVKFRDVLVTTGEKVSPATIGSVDTPGLFDLGNLSEVRTGTNTATAVGADSLYLIDLNRASVFKDIASGSPGYGVQGEGTPTAFLLSGVPANEGSLASRIVDGGTAGNSFDVFALTGVREAHLGPDQTMKVTFHDASGAPIGPIGTIPASIAIKDRDLTAEEIEDSQSAGYLAFQRTKRAVEWSEDWAAGDLAKVFRMTVDVQRSNDTEALQRYGAFSAIIDVALRSEQLSAPGTIVAGSSVGVVHRNLATIRSKDASGWGAPIEGTAQFTVYAADTVYGDATATWTAADQANFLVAGHQTNSRITLDAHNKTAIAGGSGYPWEEWAQPNSIPIGVDQLTVGAGGAPGDGANPFAITQFTGITSVVWPERNGAKKDETNAQKRVAGELTYRFADGTSAVIPAPVGAAPASLNPEPSRWADVVGVSMTWAEDGKFIGTLRKADEVQARVVFTSELLDFVRDGYSYVFVAGNPISLASGEGIDGALQLPGATVDQEANLLPEFDIRLASLPVEKRTGNGLNVFIDVADSAVAMSVTVAGPQPLYRDPAALRGTNVRWTLANKNTGNIPVGSLRLATASELLDDGGGSWPSVDPDGGYALEPGSALDAFDVTAARVIYPVGASTATVWARGEDGAWSDAITAASNSAIALPQTGSGPQTWAEATGFRVQFDGNESKRERILKQAEGRLLLDTRLRETLRSDPGQRAPATELPQARTQWETELTGAGASYLGTFDASLAEVTDDNAILPISPGSPDPLTKKYAGRYDIGSNTGTTTVKGNPGSWVNFFLVLENRGPATSSLYNLVVKDTLPAELTYNAVNESATWEVVSAPSGLSKKPTMTLVPGASTSMQWAWPADQVLRPGERVVIRVPLQVDDGVAAGTSAQNRVLLQGTGIDRAPVASVCAEGQPANGACVSDAYVSSLRNDSVRAESYLDSAVGGSSVWEGAPGAVCDPSTVADWSDGTWVRTPCLAETTVGGALKYRVKLINSGNIDLGELRFVDELPGVGDQGAVLDGERGSKWTPTLVPGSVRLLGGAEAVALGARGDASLGGSGFRFSSTAKACTLRPDAYAGPDTLACAAGSWSGTATAASHSIGGDILFDSAARLAGGEFVIVEFEMAVPATGLSAGVGWNTAAVTARPSAQTNWMPAAESPRSGARAQDTELTLTLDLADDAITPWHRNATGYELSYSCLAPGATEPVVATASFGPPDAETGAFAPVTVKQMPRGAVCEVVNEEYTPVTATAPGQYGTARATDPAGNATGFSFSTGPADPITLGEPGENLIAVTNTFAPSALTVGVDVAGDATSFLPADAEFSVAMTCSFGGVTEQLEPFALRAGETRTMPNLPVGVNCSATETDHRGAGLVTATLDGADTPLTADRTLTAPTLNPGGHEAWFLNTFAAGGDLTVLKRVETPKAGTAVGDVGFGLSCSLGGYPIDLGDRATLSMSFAPGETSASASVTGLPVGAECTVTETEAGGANITAPDRTVTVLDGDEVIVEMVNVFSPAALALTKQVTGPGARESRVPSSFDLRATCTRELTVGGEAITVTDFDGLTAVTPGAVSTVDGLPEGSSCAVTEPDRRGAERTTVESITAGVVDGDPAADAALVTLLGPDDGGEAVPTEVRATNQFAATEGIGVTGTDSRLLLGGGALALLAGAAAIWFARRRRGASA